MEEKGEVKMVELKEIADNIIKGQAPKVKEITQKAIDENIPVRSILEQGLIAGMSIIGERFKKNEVYLQEELISSTAMKN